MILNRYIKGKDRLVRVIEAKAMNWYTENQIDSLKTD